MTARTPTATTSPAKRLDDIEDRLDRLEGLLRMIFQCPELHHGIRQSGLRLISGGEEATDAS